MTRLRNFVLGGIAALAIGGVASSASAGESGTFQNRLNGATIGLPLGALPPPGLYTGLETAYLGLLGQNGGSGNQGTAGPNRSSLALPAIAQALPLLWVPGWNVFGATYSASVVQAWYIGFVAGSLGSLNSPATGIPGAPAGTFATFEVLANTFWQPLNLSWNVGGGWFIATTFSFTAPDTSRWVGTPNPDYWTFEPAVAFSYLGSNWVASANFFYDINTQSRNICCALGGTAGNNIRSGDALYGDFFATYKLGKWQFGPVAYFEQQTTNDTGSGCNPANVGGARLCGRFQTVAAGGLVGYDFGPVDFQVWVTQDIHRSDAIDGFNVWSRIGFKLWGPEAPPVKPLVSKN